MEKNEKLQGLIASREELKEALNELINHFEECKKQPGQYISFINEKRKQIDTLNDKINMTLETESEVVEEVMLQCEYDSVLLEFIRKLENAKEEAALIHLKLKKFSGDTAEWESFWDSFETIVDKSPDLTNVLKFIYLSSLLEGRALKAIQGYGFTNQGYVLAVRELKRRFAKQSVPKWENALSSEFTELGKLKNFVAKLETGSLTEGIKVKNCESEIYINSEMELKNDSRIESKENEEFDNKVFKQCEFQTEVETVLNLSESACQVLCEQTSIFPSGESFICRENFDFHIDNQVVESICNDYQFNQENLSLTDGQIETFENYKKLKSFDSEDSKPENLSLSVLPKMSNLNSMLFLSNRFDTVSDETLSSSLISIKSTIDRLNMEQYKVEVNDTASSNFEPLLLLDFTDSRDNNIENTVIIQHAELFSLDANGFNFVYDSKPSEVIPCTRCRVNDAKNSVSCQISVGKITESYDCNLENNKEIVYCYGLLMFLYFESLRYLHGSQLKQYEVSKFDVNRNYIGVSPKFQFAYCLFQNRSSVHLVERIPWWESDRYMKGGRLCVIKEKDVHTRCGGHLKVITSTVNKFLIEFIDKVLNLRFNSLVFIFKLFCCSCVAKLDVRGTIIL